jgi:hypothetical protein
MKLKESTTKIRNKIAAHSTEIIAIGSAVAGVIIAVAIMKVIDENVETQVDVNPVFCIDEEDLKMMVEEDVTVVFKKPRNGEEIRISYHPNHDEDCLK